jgi:hypothetical protein
MGLKHKDFPKIKLVYSDSYSETVPQIFFYLFQTILLNNYALESEGVFRLSCNREQLNNLILRLQCGDFQVIPVFKSLPHEVAGLIKEILRELKVPVCNFSIYPKFRDIKDSSNIDQIVDLLHEMEKEDSDLLMYIVGSLNKVQKRQDVNKMTTYNLAVILSPNLFRPE